MMVARLFLLAAVLTLPAAATRAEQVAAPAKAPPSKSTDKPAAKPAAEAPAPEAAKATPSPAPVRVVTGFSTPESVLWDEAQNRYLVSNIAGKPTDKDNNGFISVMSADGKITNERFIAGGAGGVTLHAPKGSAIAKGVLYVTDIDVVRMFDAKTGAPKGELALPGASFLNDVVATADGKVFVSDTGMDANFKPSGTDGVWVIKDGKASAHFASKDLGGPNGLAVVGNDVVVNCFNSNELFKLDSKKGKLEVTKAPNGGGDGLFVQSDGTVWSSSWGGNAIYRGRLGGTFEVAIKDVGAPADFAVNTKAKQLVVPRFMDNTVEFYALP